MCRFHTWVRKIPWKRKWQSTPVFLPGESHGQRSLADYSPWDHEEFETTEATEQTCMHLYMYNYYVCSVYIVRLLLTLCVRVLSYVGLFATPWTVARQAPVSIEFSSQEYWSELPFISPGDIPNPGIKLVSLMSPGLADRFFTTEPPRKPLWTIRL